MIDRINLIMQAKNINASQFADEINIQRSGMSHIMSGRNKPSLDFIMRVLKRYPEIDTNWLLFGKGEMYTTSAGQQFMVKNPAEAPVEPQNVDNQTSMFENNGQMDMFSPETDFSEPQNAVFETAEPQPVANLEKTQDVENPQVEKTAERAENSINESIPTRSEEKPIVEKNTKKAVRYLVFYSDHTFEEFTRAED